MRGASQRGDEAIAMRTCGCRRCCMEQLGDIGEEEGMPLSTFVGTRDLLALSPPHPCCTVPGRVLWVVCVCEGAFRGVFLFLSLGAFLW